MSAGSVATERVLALFFSLLSRCFSLSIISGFKTLRWPSLNNQSEKQSESGVYCSDFFLAPRGTIRGSHSYCFYNTSISGFKSLRWRSLNNQCENECGERSYRTSSCSVFFLALTLFLALNNFRF
jgi:hypothetical protein